MKLLIKAVLLLVLMAIYYVIGFYGGSKEAEFRGVEIATKITQIKSLCLEKDGFTLIAGGIAECYVDGKLFYQFKL